VRKPVVSKIKSPPPGPATSAAGKAGVSVASGFGFHVREIRAGSRRLLRFFCGIRRQPDHFFRKERRRRGQSCKAGLPRISGVMHSFVPWLQNVRAGSRRLLRFFVASGVSRIIFSGKRGVGEGVSCKAGLPRISGVMHSFVPWLQNVRAGSRRLLRFFCGIRRQPDHFFRKERSWRGLILQSGAAANQRG
jgi:hypothetical protein